MSTDSATARPAIRAAGIDKRFGETAAVSGVDLEVCEGSIVALLGPSGSGKTTLLRILAGFETPDAGSVEISGREVVSPTSWVEPEDRHIGMVFQDGALFPHLTVEANIAFGDPEPDRARDCLELVGLSDRGGAYPHELSGGERQRVALARALATDPAVVFLDEPFAALDAGLRIALREEVAGILRLAGATAVLVTHDQQEALSLADEVVVLRDGRVEQRGTPHDLYERPATRWVAEFLGDADVLPGSADGQRVTCELGSFPADDAPVGDVDVVIRPEVVAITSHDGPDSTPATVLGRAFHGHDQLVRLALPSGIEVQSRIAGTAEIEPGSLVHVRVDGPVRVIDRS